MLTPHAIRLKRSNFYEIVHWTKTSFENLEETYHDATKEGKVLYVVFKRNDDGSAWWMNYTEALLRSEYGQDLNIRSFEDQFYKL